MKTLVNNQNSERMNGESQVKNNEKKAVKLQVRVTFIDEAPEDGDRIRKDMEKLLANDVSWGKIGTYFYMVKNGNEEEGYELSVEVTKKKGKKEEKKWRTMRIRIEVLNRIWVKNERGIWVARILTAKEMKQREKEQNVVKADKFDAPVKIEAADGTEADYREVLESGTITNLVDGELTFGEERVKVTACGDDWSLTGYGRDGKQVLWKHFTTGEAAALLARLHTGKYHLTDAPEWAKVGQVCRYGKSHSFVKIVETMNEHHGARVQFVDCLKKEEPFFLDYWDMEPYELPTWCKPGTRVRRNHHQYKTGLNDLEGVIVCQHTEFRFQVEWQKKGDYSDTWTESHLCYFDLEPIGTEPTGTDDDTLETASEIRDDYKPGDRVKHKGTGEVGTIVSVREGDVAKALGGRRKLYTIDFGRSITFAFDIEMNMGEYLAEALEPVLESVGEIKDSRFNAMVTDGLVRFTDNGLLFDLLEQLGGCPEGEPGAFKCTQGDFYDAVQNIGVHIDCPEVYEADDHDMMMQTIRRMNTSAYQVGVLLNVIWTMADASVGFIYFKAA